MDGSALPPLVIFKGKTLSRAWLPTSPLNGWMYSVNTQGWTSNEYCKKWITQNFKPNTRAKADGRPRLLIFDGHGSHTTPDILAHCLANQVHLALLPPHTSYLTQPLDIGIFSALKKHMTCELDWLIRTGISHMQKAEWMDAFIPARSKAFTESNIFSGWSGTGLNPFWPPTVLQRVPIPPPTDISTSWETTPQFESPLQHPDLTSSPIDNAPLRATNIHIKECALNRNIAFDTSVRQHVVRLTHTLDRSLTKTRIISKQLLELQEIVSARKKRQSGKHAILCGETIVATIETFKCLQKADEEAKAYRLKRQNLAHPTAPGPPLIHTPTNVNCEDFNSDNDNLDWIILALS